MPANFPNSPYIGRYAPSPTGQLHLGNVQTALLAWLHARLSQGEFLIRMEDLDTPRVVAGSAQNIISDLKWLGLDWDAEVVYQSERTKLYDEAFAQLQADQHLFPCFCSRKDIREALSAPHGESVHYPGTCRELNSEQIAERAQEKQPAYRVKTPDGLDDFVVKRADGLYAYHLAVTVDDLAQGVTHAVRGGDLSSSDQPQKFLAKLLEPKAAPINYISLPLKLDAQGNKMSKRDGSDSLEYYRAQGLNAAGLIALLSNDLGLTKNQSSLSATDLLNAVTLEDWNSAVRVER